MSGCKDDKDPNLNEHPAAPKNIAWIESTMRRHYLWYDNIPATDRLDYTITEEKFFASLLSDNDGKVYYVDGNRRHYYYSTIKSLSGASTYSGNAEHSYGFEFVYIYSNSERSSIQLLVQYILDDSPAKESGLRRGDWIIEIDGRPITTDDIAPITNGEGEMLFTVQRWDTRWGRFATIPEKIQMPAARQVIDHPIHLAKIITVAEEKKVGYLVYNHFTMGTSDNDDSYDKELRNLSATTFEGVDEFVLDLRYNSGGNISSAILLCAILAPGSELEKPFCYLQYNDKATPKERTYTAGREQLKSNGRNLNLSTLYVLTSSNSASASELVINSLRPYMNVVIIGEQTEGKNVASSNFTSNDRLWEISPIIGRVYNSERSSDYEDGFFPNHTLSEAFTPVAQNSNIVMLNEVRELGDENERLLRVALNLIDNNTDANTRSTIAKDAPTYTLASFNSINRKATNGVIVDINP